MPAALSAPTSGLRLFLLVLLLVAGALGQPLP
jgi:hypothetical protein